MKYLGFLLILLCRISAAGNTLYVYIEDTRPEVTAAWYSESHFRSDLVKEALETPIADLIAARPEFAEYYWELHWARHNLSEQMRVEVIVREFATTFVPEDCVLPAWEMSEYGYEPTTFLDDCYWTPIMLVNYLEYIASLLNIASEPWDTYRYFSEYLQNDRWMYWVKIDEYTKTEPFLEFEAEVTYVVQEYIPRLTPSPLRNINYPKKLFVTGRYTDADGKPAFFSRVEMHPDNTEMDRRVLLYELDRGLNILLSVTEKQKVEEILRLREQHPPVNCPSPDGVEAELHRP